MVVGIIFVALVFVALVYFFSSTSLGEYFGAILAILQGVACVGWFLLVTAACMKVLWG